MKKNIYILFVLLLISFKSLSQEIDTTKSIYILDIKQEIGPAAWRHTQKAFSQAKKHNAEAIIIDMNTYGGLLDAADSIRTKILNEKIPVYVFINNNAASAGALISLACDSIYMIPGGRIGAATVVTQDGSKAPDKYQAYMRATMRATAEFHGADTIIKQNDTIIKWHRNPKIAEAMVDESIEIPGIVDSTKILTFTTNEAIKNGYCEGKAKNLQDLINKLGYSNYKQYKYQPGALDNIIDFLINPMIQGLLIMLIMGGLYFELQSPGVGFPLAAAITAAILYFAPLYLEGFAENWEILIFIMGIVLIALEVFVIPGFGIAGISGIILAVTGLTLSLVDNIVFDYGNLEFTIKVLVKAFMTVIISLILAFILSIILGKKLLTQTSLGNFILKTSQEKEKGYYIAQNEINLIDKQGITQTKLRPAGKVIIDNELYDAVALYGFIDKNEKVKVVKQKTAQIYVVKIENK